MNFLNLVQEKEAKDSANSSLLSHSGSGLHFIVPSIPFTTAYSFLMSGPHSKTLLLITIILASFRHFGSLA